MRGLAFLFVGLLGVTAPRTSVASVVEPSGHGHCGEAAQALPVVTGSALEASAPAMTDHGPCDSCPETTCAGHGHCAAGGPAAGEQPGAIPAHPAPLLRRVAVLTRPARSLPAVAPPTPPPNHLTVS